MSISVCVATYNGRLFVERQLTSILEQLGAEDEVVVVDDRSTDGTLELVRAIREPRIRMFQNEHNRGEVFSFGRAISLARNQFIFLADQDDVWIPGRVALMKDELASGALLVATNFEWMDSAENPIVVPFDGVRACDSQRNVKNIIDIFLGRTTYFGCAMAFQRGLADLVTPMPRSVESHDAWIAIAANLLGTISHLENATLRKRKHANNATSTVSSRSLYMKLRARVVMALGIGHVAVRLLRNRRAREWLASIAPDKRREAGSR
jgi:glycosyltransferase involved in cell wall biosynthesis